MTSGNVSDEPIAYRNDEALERLGAMADLFLLHDRPIHMRTDDSIVRAIDRRPPLLLRRSRGYVPDSLPVPLGTGGAVLACGAELKSTFCLAKGGRAWVSHHIGDLQNAETSRSFREGIAHYERLLAVTPAVVAHDLHPDYLSSAYAVEREDVRLVGVQHHHAHLAACLAEHGETGPAVGVIFDGSGYGTDGTVWGGEILVGDLAGVVRAGSLHAVRMPGGEAAIREPWRMACAWLVAAQGALPPMPLAFQGRIDVGRWRAVSQIAASGLSSPVTSSVGRLFDAVAALVGLRMVVTFEGQAATLLEASVDPAERGTLPMPVERSDEGLTIDAYETIREVVAQVAAGVPTGVVAARFHNALAGAAASACAMAAADADVDLVVLSGGVFQNRVMLERTARLVVSAGLRVLVPERLPPNDGGVSYGQAAVAAATT